MPSRAAVAQRPADEQRIVGKPGMGRIAQYQAMNVLALAGVLEAFVGKVVEASRAGRRLMPNSR
ncbi:hypothetical protein P4131_29415 [Pseudomonas aeruginosa]|nr:hypothetical protein [Pseudomonas aeruginosa]